MENARGERLFVKIVFVLLLGGGLFGVIFYGFYHDRVFPGVKVAGQELGNLTQAEAEVLLASYGQRVTSKPVLFYFNSRVWRASCGELGISLDLPATLTAAWAVGRKGNWEERLPGYFFAWREGKEIPPVYKVDEHRFQTKLQALTIALSVPPQSAYFSFTAQDEVEIVPSRAGQEVDSEKALAALLSLLEASPNLSAFKINLYLRSVPPPVSTADLEKMRITGKLAAYQTRFDPLNQNRSGNIRLAAQALDGYLLPPGGTFSFNAVVGPRTVDTGYSEAIVIENGQFVPGIGGGVCQVSSTLYNVALRAGLKVIERHRHSLPVGYVAPGTDATVAYGFIDLEFLNNTPGYLLLKASVDKGELTMKIFGFAEDLPVVQIIPRVEEVIPPPVIKKEDPTLPEGKTLFEKEGKKGYKVKVIRSFLKNGQVVKSEIISRDLYPAQPQVVRVGTKKETLPEATSPEKGEEVLLPLGETKPWEEEPLPNGLPSPISGTSPPKERPFAQDNGGGCPPFYFLAGVTFPGRFFCPGRASCMDSPGHLGPGNRGTFGFPKIGSFPIPFCNLYLLAGY